MSQLFVSVKDFFKICLHYIAAFILFYLIAPGILGVFLFQKPTKNFKIRGEIKDYIEIKESMMLVEKIRLEREQLIVNWI
ncbi:hypothetical protein MWH25_12225 [Natroniella acetigena]|uniref:hypothetical protein n=1 Tax=Natroniella acetigena TaxID=52004 RepID=UPI00200A7C8C|nr:hypothetical protein [Natroniella acetigena]MCK8828492.1 hypothetical protein [Natroniella acetigena]